MDNSPISSARQEDSSNDTTASEEKEIEFNSASVDEKAENTENTENTGDSTYSLLDEESQNIDPEIEKNEGEYEDDSLTNPILLVTEDSDNITTTQSQQESKEDSLAENEEDLEHIESEHQDDDLLFIHPEDNGDGDSDNMVSSIHTSDDTGSENSFMRDDSSGMLVSPPDIRTPSSPSQNSEDNSSIESMLTGDVMDSLSNFSGQSDYIERDVPVVPAPGETQSQILAPLDQLDDNDDEDGNGENRIQMTPILTKAVETDDDPPSPTLPEFSSSTTRRDIHANNSNINSIRNHLPRSHLPEILLRHQRHNILDFRNRQDSSLSEITLNIFYHQILLPFFQGFSWGIGMHLYRYMRNGFSIRNLWRPLPGSTGGASSNNINNMN